MAATGSTFTMVGQVIKAGVVTGRRGASACAVGSGGSHRAGRLVGRGAEWVLFAVVNGEVGR